LQISFSKDGFFLSIGAHCGTPVDEEGKSFYPDTTPGIMSVLYAYSKDALYDCENNDHDRKIYAATYLGPMAWKSSISHKEQSLIEEDYRTFNNLITPARPQDEKDVMDDPLFVMKVGRRRNGFFGPVKDKVATLSSAGTEERARIKSVWLLSCTRQQLRTG
jgi:hypothetical protein